MWNNLSEVVNSVFLEQEKNLNGQKESAFYQTKRDSLDSLLKAELPTVKHEEWKYTPIYQQLNDTFLFDPKVEVFNQNIDQYKIAGKEACYLVFVNGYYLESKSDKLPEGLILKLAKNVVFDPKFQSTVDSIKSVGDYNIDGFKDLNHVFADKGIVLEVSKSSKISQPIIFLYFNETLSEPVFTQSYNYVLINDNAEVSITEYLVSQEVFSTSVSNITTQFLIGDQSKVEYLKLVLLNGKSSHIGTAQFIINGKSVVNTYNITLEGKIIRNNLNVAINQSGAEAHLFGLAWLKNHTHVDNHTVVDHIMPHCESNEVYKNIVDDYATSIFNGKIFVRKDAQKTNAYQSSKNVLLSANAIANSKPQLEIWADDVKCSHGSTTGQLDSEAMFYLRARGLSEKSAKTMLTKAFAADVISKIPNETIRTFVEKYMSDNEDHI